VGDGFHAGEDAAAGGKVETPGAVLALEYDFGRRDVLRKRRGRRSVVECVAGGSVRRSTRFNRADYRNAGRGRIGGTVRP
jgi:hypothetical protein